MNIPCPGAALYQTLNDNQYSRSQLMLVSLPRFIHPVTCVLSYCVLVDFALSCVFRGERTIVYFRPLRTGPFVFEQGRF
jgi:hypothetical protein